MSVRDDSDGQDKGRSAGDAKTPSKSQHQGADRRMRRRSPTGEVGHALRSVYDDTLKESIPPEMLDLLGKLG